MNNLAHYAIDYADMEFRGEPYNGLSLLATLKSLDAQRAASRATWEGWSAWDVAIHVAWYKVVIAQDLGLQSPLLNFPWKGESSPLRPELCDAAAWATCLEYLEAVHVLVHEALPQLGDDFLQTLMPRWGIPWGHALAWYLGHDTYHSSQIRSMGVVGLKEEWHPPLR